MVSRTLVISENREIMATGSAVKEGLIPPIKPIWDVHLRDTNIILAPDGYCYMIGSTGDDIWRYNDGIELWKSPDLIDWSYLGLVWSIERDGGWEKQWRDHRGPVRSIWAPEIRFIHNSFYITFGMPPGGMSILASTTGKPEGPYIHATDPNAPLMGGVGENSFLIDPTLFEDDDGDVYFTHGPGTFIWRLKNDLSGFAEEPRPIRLADRSDENNTRLRPENDIGYEGATVFKANGLYYFGATDHWLGRYSMCMAVSENLHGPYRMRHESVPCNGGCNFFKGKDGHWYTTLFGNDHQMPWREKPGIVRIDYDDQRKIVIAREQPEFILLNQEAN